MKDKYLIGLANLVNGSMLGYEKNSKVEEYRKWITDYVENLEFKEKITRHNKNWVFKYQEKKLLFIYLYLEYYKKDITDRCCSMLTDIVLDNDVLEDINERLYIIKWNKYNELQKENKKLNEKVKALSEWNNNKDARNSRQRVANAKLLKENKQLKMINKEYERLNRENGRGFKITNVQEYDVYRLLSYKNYKDNWNNLKEYFRFLEINSTGGNKEFIENIILLMQELEKEEK